MLDQPWLGCVASSGTGALDLVMSLREGDVVGVSSCVVSKRIASLV